MSDVGIEYKFPKIAKIGYRLTSPQNPHYNCIAWAAENDKLWWWPDPMGQAYWPDEIPRVNTLENFILLYRKFGYEVCDNATFEQGFLKVAVYVDDNGKPTHAARQLANGKWTSKLGQYKDIEHNTVEALFGIEYGSVGVVMKR